MHPGKCLIMINPKHRITATIEGKDSDIKYVGELEIHIVHYAIYNAWPGPLLIVMCLALDTKCLDTPVLDPQPCFL